LQFDIVKDGAKVADWGDGTPHATFGELALMYNAPRAASVVVSSPPPSSYPATAAAAAADGAVVWVIDRRTFRRAVARAAAAQHAALKTALRRVGLLEGLSDGQLDRLADAATVVQYGPGEQIIKKASRVRRC
jgi:cAMP-dependent protein kinase regulator